ncbi:hypothetical protein B0H14DRAFT_2681447 [Mycena olivaceomarginata]|nr:hypothetical protein B0H14DRAFT_2681447 [Mycena olivaceomarginata]
MTLYQTAPPKNLPDIWPKLAKPGPQAQALRRQPNDTELVPPVPAHLRDQECLYGYFITDQLLQTYWAAHPDARPSNLIANPNNHTVYGVAQQFGLEIWIDRKRDPVDAIAWFSYTDGGEVQTETVPTATSLEPFEKELGITERAQWLGTGLPVMLD